MPANLQELGLAGARVPTEEDVDIGAEIAAPCVLKVLASASKQLQENSLLDVVVLVDTGGCEGVHVCVRVCMCVCVCEGVSVCVCATLDRE